MLWDFVIHWCGSFRFLHVIFESRLWKEFHRKKFFSHKATWKSLFIKLLHSFLGFICELASQACGGCKLHEMKLWNSFLGAQTSLGRLFTFEHVYLFLPYYVSILSAQPYLCNVTFYLAFFIMFKKPFNNLRSKCVSSKKKKKNLESIPIM